MRSLSLLLVPLWATLVEGSSTQIWFSFCKNCDLESMKLFGPEMVNVKGSKDETCMTYCIGSDNVGHREKMGVLEWLLGQDGTIDNETFSMVCLESTWNKVHDPQWEQFPLRLLDELEHGSELNGHFDFAEALCHASFHGCVQSVRELLRKTKTANFDKIIGKGHHIYNYSYTPTSPLSEAILGNQIEVIEVLLTESDATLDHQSGTCPVSLALRAHNYKVAEFLIRLGAPLTKSWLIADMTADVRRMLVDAKAYRERMCQTVENYLVFFVGDGEKGGRPAEVGERDLEFIREQLDKLEYSPLEVRTCLAPRHN